MEIFITIHQPSESICSTVFAFADKLVSNCADFGHRMVPQGLVFGSEIGLVVCYGSGIRLGLV